MCPNRSALCTCFLSLAEFPQPQAADDLNGEQTNSARGGLTLLDRGHVMWTDPRWSVQIEEVGQS